MKKSLLFVLLLLVLQACIAAPDKPPESGPTTSYLDYSQRDDVLSGGVKLIPITTPKGTFRVWTKRIGNNPRLKVLLLHGGPGATHEYLEAFDSFFPAANIEYYYYDQLGSFYSDQPKEPDLWDLCRASWRKSSRCARRLSSTKITSIFMGNRGAACWRSSMR